MKNYRVTRRTAYMWKRQAHCTCEIDLGNLRRRVFATHIRVGLVSYNGDNAEKVKGRMKGGAAKQGRGEEFLSALAGHFRRAITFISNVLHFFMC